KGQPPTAPSCAAIFYIRCIKSFHVKHTTNYLHWSNLLLKKKSEKDNMTRLCLLIALQSSVSAGTMKKNPCSKKLCQNCYFKIQVENINHKQCLQLLNLQGCCTPFLHTAGMFSVQKDQCGNLIQPLASEIPKNEVKISDMIPLSSDELSEKVEEFFEKNEGQLETRSAEIQCAGNMEAASNIIISGIVIFVATIGGAMMYLNRKFNERELKFKRLRSNKQNNTKQCSSSSMIGSVAIGSTIPLLASENKGVIGSDESPKEQDDNCSANSRSDGCNPISKK
ncbi:unnamed protein product, partial [Oikopleura dioica]